MAGKVPSFIKMKENAAIYDGPAGSEFCFYVPEIYFGTSSAIIVGDMVSLLGVLDYSIFDKSGKNNGLHSFRFPSIFLCKPYTIEKLKEVKLTKAMPVQDYRILKFRPGDEVIYSIKVPKVFENIEEFMRLFFITANISTSTPYDKIHEYFSENASLNGGAYHIPMQWFGMMVATNARDPEDYRVEYRRTKKLDTDKTGYTLLPLQAIPKYVSPFVSITSENFDEALMGSMLIDKPKDSPMERVLMH